MEYNKIIMKGDKMVNFADAVTKIQCRNLVTKTPTRQGVKDLLECTSRVNEKLSNGFNLGGIPTLSQDTVMLGMGAKTTKKIPHRNIIKELMNNKSIIKENASLSIYPINNNPQKRYINKEI